MLDHRPGPADRRTGRQLDVSALRAAHRLRAARPGDRTGRAAGRRGVTFPAFDGVPRVQPVPLRRGSVQTAPETSVQRRCRAQQRRWSMASTDARESTVQASDGPMAAGVGGPTRASIGARTLRQDRWWLYPAATFTVFFCVHRLLHDPGVHGQGLLLRALPLAVLLAVPRRLRRGLVRLRPAVRLVPALGGADHPDLPAGLPADLLLLPQGLLPRRSGSRRRPAASPSRTRSTPARPGSR